VRHKARGMRRDRLVHRLLQVGNHSARSAAALAPIVL